MTPGQLVAEIRPLLPPTAQVRTGQQEAKQAAKDTNGFLSILEYFLLAFGFIALFVGTFVIANTLGITIAQRMRELATLRTLGATRRQVYWSVVLEAFVIGVIASVIGLFLGLGLAKLLNALFVAFGIDLPQVGTVFATRTVVVALLVGVVVTLIAAIRPALRATRVQPIAAVREGAVLPPSRLARFGPYIAIVVIALAVGLMLFGLFGGGSTKLRLIALGIGAVGVFIGVSMLAPTLVPPVARVLGFPAARFGGAPGMLARGNSIRNPSRTASTASALMIGLTLVTLVSVLAAGLKTTFEDSVNKLFTADYALTSQNGFTPTSIASEQALRGVPGVEVVSGVRAGRGRGVRQPDRHHGRRAEREQGDRPEVGGRQPCDAGAARPRRRLRREELRQGPQPHGRLADRPEDAVGRHAAPEAARHLRSAEGRLAVRRRHDLGAAVRPRVREPAEPLRVREDARRRHRREHRRGSSRRSQRFPDAKIQTKRRSSRRSRSRASTSC